MASGRNMIVLLIFAFANKSFSETIIQMHPAAHRAHADDKGSGFYCESWRYSVETNDAGEWRSIPARCIEFVKDYITGERYRSDLEVVAENSLEFVKNVKMVGDGKDAWVFDIDETLLSNVPYYAAHGFGSESFNEKTFNDWVGLAEAPALTASLRLYKELSEMGVTLILLTGREEFQRNATEKNLLDAGFSHWEKLLLRNPLDKGKPATTYKSERRKEIEDEGYTIHGCSGDQWSDLMGYAMGIRSFKLPNPMYYIP
ncbi:hypothetical protein DCAR_0830688 [Daucus carota subsp. sativus]|uniref:Acid phosphatase n=2 Tax=Daucus carota subsp. sativus TaxID=79200 RepID=A0AAF0XNA3_DAUCS|nr:PREDICTED: acid phosphatase 1-like [Daucus carota subsp. sativus]WOH11208.1 hypothetical protein DCAR_0830688 [Daucus carota subsp. sativus]